MNIRHGRIRALRDGVEGVTVGYRWSGRGDIKESCTTPGVTLENLEPPPGGGVERRFLRFQRALNKDEEHPYEFVVECKVRDQPPEPFYQNCFEFRVDVLVMRVVFPVGQFPESVVYQQTYRSLQIVEGPEPLRIDPLTGAVEKTIRDPVVNRNHLIKWS